MDIIDITNFMYLDISAAIPDLFYIFGIALGFGMAMVIILHFMSFAVFGLIELLDIKEK